MEYMSTNAAAREDTPHWAPPGSEVPGGGPDASGGQPGSRRRRWVLWLFAITPLVLALGVAGFALEPLRRPLPAPTAETLVAASVRLPGTPPALPWPAKGQAAVAIDGIGGLGTSGAATPVPIASVAKIMTVYLTLVDHPLGADESGPGITITARQAATYQQRSAGTDESLVAVAAGAVFTERQALQAVMLPSANNMARILAEWDAGTEADFVGKMNAEATRLGMTGTRYTDPSGLDPGTVSTAADQVVLARKAMTLPAFAAIAAQPQATLPVAGTVTNYNTLLGKDGVVGVKTGSTEQAGGCFVFAARFTAHGRELTVLGAVLGQPGAGTPQQLSAAFAATQSLIRAAGKSLVSHTVIRAGQSIVAVHGPLDTATTLTATADVTVVGLPGMEVTLGVQVPPVPRRLAAGTEHGTLTVTAGESPAARAALRSADPLLPPGNWTRIKRHR